MIKPINQGKCESNCSGGIEKIDSPPEEMAKVATFGTGKAQVMKGEGMMNRSTTTIGVLSFTIVLALLASAAWGDELPDASMECETATGIDERFNKLIADLRQRFSEKAQPGVEEFQVNDNFRNIQIVYRRNGTQVYYYIDAGDGLDSLDSLDSIVKQLRSRWLENRQAIEHDRSVILDKFGALEEAAAKKCKYKGKEYSEGSEVCQVTTLKRCTGGQWVTVGFDCKGLTDGQTLSAESMD